MEGGQAATYTKGCQQLVRTGICVHLGVHVCVLTRGVTQQSVSRRLRVHTHGCDCNTTEPQPLCQPHLYRRKLLTLLV